MAHPYSSHLPMRWAQSTNARMRALDFKIQIEVKANLQEMNLQVIELALYNI